MPNGQISAGGGQAQNKQASGRRSKKWIPWVAAGSSVLLVVCIIVAVFVFSSGGDTEEERAENHSSSEKAEETPKVAEKLAFTADTYEVETNQEMDLSRYLQCEGIGTDGVAWSSEDQDVIVGSNGHIVMKAYGSSCTIQAKSKTDETVGASCVVKTRSEEDDFAYQVQTLNGQHKEDETGTDGAVSLAYSNEENQKINVGTENVPAGKRNKKYTWDKRVFYRLEEIYPEKDTDGQINFYRVEKKQFINADTGNVMEYEIYHHPDTDVVNKIVSIEYMNTIKVLSIREYYFTNRGKVNFVYAYQDINYTPSYASPDRDGERFLFHKDSMVTWRKVEGGEETNICCGEKERKRVSDGHENVKLYEKCTEATRKKYDKKELEILNAAYNTFNKVKDFEGVSTISGYLNEAEGNGVSDASVELVTDQYGKSVCQVNTDKDGYYQIFVPTRKMAYRLNYKKDSFLDETLYDIEADVDEISLNQEIVYLSRTDENVYDCELTFYDALNKAEDGSGMAELSNETVAVRRGVNNRTGKPVFEDYVSGESVVVSLSAGMYTVQMSRDGYMDTFSSLFVSGKTSNQIAVYATPELGEDEYRIVLTWGGTPGDLDSHLFAPNNGTGMSEDDFHICYYHMSDSVDNTSLDVDDTDGFGPETTTINAVMQGQYKFYVCDFTNCSRNNESSYDMSNSGATVRVYGHQGLIQTFYVPVNRQGVIWEVFEMRDGKVIPTQRYYDKIGNKTWWKSEK